MWNTKVTHILANIPSEIAAIGMDISHCGQWGGATNRI